MGSPFLGALIKSQLKACWHFGNLRTLRLRKSSRHLANRIFKCILFEEQNLFCFKIYVSLFIKNQIDTKSAMVQVMACWRDGDKLLPEPMLTKMSDAIWRDYATVI